MDENPYQPPQVIEPPAEESRFRLPEIFVKYAEYLVATIFLLVTVVICLFFLLMALNLF